MILFFTGKWYQISPLLKYPTAEIIVLVMDNPASHIAAALYETFKPADAKRIWDLLEFVYTPKHGSWLNMAEIELNVLIKQCFIRRIHKIKTIREEVKPGRTTETIRMQK